MRLYQKTLESNSNIERTRFLLFEWGRWARSIGAYAGWPLVELVGSTVATPMISDDEAVLIDKTIALLEHQNKETHKAIMLSFYANLPNYRVAEEMGINRHKVATIVESGVAWVDGVRCVLDENT